MIALTLTWLAVAIALLALYLRKAYNKLAEREVNHLPVFPLLGNLLWVITRREHMLECMMRTIKAFPDDKIVGHYDLSTPVTIVQDLELIKRITVKDFDHFVDKRSFTSEEDPVFGRGLLMLRGDEWRAMRSTMTPAFTVAKVRLMVPLMEEVGVEMMKVLKEKMKESGKSYIDVQAKDLATRYANDVVASCVFGLKVNSHAEDNQFYKNTHEITSFSLLRVLKIFFYRRFPGLSKMLKISIAAQENTDFFTDMVFSTIKHREKENIVRNDMINILMEVKKGQLKHEKDTTDSDAGFAVVKDSTMIRKQYNIEWTDTDLIAQAALFLFAGYDSISTEIAFLLHELALNPDVQEKLVQEIKEHYDKNGGKFDYETIQRMTYLDMVVSEVLRMWPVGAITDRLCVKDYNLGRPNSKATKDYIIRKNEHVIIPVYGLHHDPKLYPDPEKFDPERFSPTNRHNINPASYMPFGAGPRGCIGSRFALCEMKMMTCQLLREIEVSPCEKTCIPSKLSEDGFLLALKGGAWVRLSIRPQK